MRTVCIHQPDFIPYLGFYHRLLLTDHFVLLDDVQFLRRGWHHRDKIKRKNGPVWLTLSVSKGPYEQKINEVNLSKEIKWIDGNLNLIKENYRQARYFDGIFPRVEQIYKANHEKLIDFNIAFMDFSLEMFDMDIEISRASDSNILSTSSDRLLELVKLNDGDCYLSGSGAKAYLDESLFAKQSIDVIWQNFSHPKYPQLHGEFEPMLSCLDLFFNCGADSARILRETMNE